MKTLPFLPETVYTLSFYNQSAGSKGPGYDISKLVSNFFCLWFRFMMFFISRKHSLEMCQGRMPQG